MEMTRVAVLYGGISAEREVSLSTGMHVIPALREAGFEAKRSLDDGIRELIKGYRMLGRGKYMNI